MKKFIMVMIAICAVAAQADIITTNMVDGGYVTASKYTSNLKYRYINYLAAGQNAILIFELPTLTGGTTISDANLYDYVGMASGDITVDLYALRVSDSDAITTSDYYTGGDDTTAATKIMDTFFTTAGTGEGEPPLFPDVNTDDTADGELATWLQDNAYSSGATPDATYAIFRLSATAESGFLFDFATMGNGAGHPGVLTIETIPEPATISLIALAGLGALIVNRIRGR